MRLNKRPTPLPLLWTAVCAQSGRITQGKKSGERRRRALTVLAVPSHVLPWALARVVGNQIRANAPILTRVPFTFINICGRQEMQQKVH